MLTIKENYSSFFKDNLLAKWKSTKKIVCFILGELERTWNFYLTTLQDVTYKVCLLLHFIFFLRIMFFVFFFFSAEKLIVLIFGVECLVVTVKYIFPRFGPSVRSSVSQPKLWPLKNKIVNTVKPLRQRPLPNNDYHFVVPFGTSIT